MGTNETEYKMGNTMFLINKQTKKKNMLIPANSLQNGCFYIHLDIC